MVSKYPARQSPGGTGTGWSISRKSPYLRIVRIARQPSKPEFRALSAPARSLRGIERVEIFRARSLLAKENSCGRRVGVRRRNDACFCGGREQCQFMLLSLKNKTLCAKVCIGSGAPFAMATATSSSPTGLTPRLLRPARTRAPISRKNPRTRVAALGHLYEHLTFVVEITWFTGDSRDCRLLS